MFGSAAQGADKLIGSGVCSINDVMARFGLPEIAEPWAEQHWMTKNYSPAEDLLDGLTGTETTGRRPTGYQYPGDRRQRRQRK